MSKNLDKANKLLLKLLKQKEKRDASGYKRVNTKQNKKQRKLRVEQFLPKVRPMTKLEEQLEGVKRKRIMDLDYKKKLAELKTQRELQIESIATPSVETLIKQEKRKAGRPKKVIDISALKQVKELYEMSVAELKEEARKEGIKTTQTKTDLIKQIKETKENAKEEKKLKEELYTAKSNKQRENAQQELNELQKQIQVLKTRTPKGNKPQQQKLLEPEPEPIKQQMKKISLDNMKKKELEDTAQYYGLKKTGNKGDIINRINKHLEGVRDPTEAKRADAADLAKLFDGLGNKVNPVIPEYGAFPPEQIVKGYKAIAQDKAANDAYEAQKKEKEANYVLSPKLANNAKQGEIEDAKNKNDEKAVENAVNEQAKKRAPKQSNKTGTI